MDRSPVFASTTANPSEDCALFALAFAGAPSRKDLTKLTTVTRRIIIQKARDQARLQPKLKPHALSPLVGGWFQVLFHSPSRGSFHLSLTLLCAIGHGGVFSLGGWAPQIQTKFHVLGPTRDILQSPQPFRLRGFHPLWPTFPCRSTRARFCNSAPAHNDWPETPTTPHAHRRYDRSEHAVWADSRSLAATWKIEVSFFSFGYLDVSVPRVRFQSLCIQLWMTVHDHCRVAPFGNLRVKGWLAPYRSLSQLPHVLHRLSMPRHPPDTLANLGPVS